ncbi:MAG TPA: hypothetical protein VES39_01590, partial [Rhodospirillales bacterium]|nr:hypothetical protein [Rhodospirillales bacterium]
MSGAAGRPLLDAVLDRLRDRSDSEHEQALIRILIVGLLFAFLAGSGTLDSPDIAVRGTGWLAGAYFIVACGHFAMIVARPAPSVVRRVFGMVADFGATTAFMWLGGEGTAPFYAI